MVTGIVDGLDEALEGRPKVSLTKVSQLFSSVIDIQILVSLTYVHKQGSD